MTPFGDFVATSAGMSFTPLDARLTYAKIGTKSRAWWARYSAMCVQRHCGEPIGMDAYDDWQR